MKSSPTSLNKLLSFEDLCQKSVLSPEACNWLKVALDPNHDAKIKVCGLPDCESDASVVIEVHKSQEISAPALAANTWDAHFVSQPAVSNALESEIAIDIDTEPGTFTQLDTKRPPVIQPYIACTTSAGLPTYDVNALCEYSHLNYNEYVVNPDRPSPKYRIIASAFKVNNTTSSLNKQGSVVCYRFDPSTKLERFEAYNVADEYLGDTLSNAIKGPPTTLAAAKLFPNSVTMEASEGVYCVNKLELNNCSPRAVVASDFIMMQNDEDHNRGFTHPGARLQFRTKGTVYNSRTNAAEIGRLGGTDTVGAYFTGLSNTTTLTFSTTTYIQIFPETDSILKGLAQTSPKCCSNALSLYQMTARSIPSGVRACDNDAGAWFRKIAHSSATVARALSPVLATNPWGQAILAGTQVADDLATSTKPKPKKVTQKKKK